MPLILVVFLVLMTPAFAWAGITGTLELSSGGTFSPITVSPVINQTTVTGSPVGSGGTLTIGTVQSIGVTSTPTFGALTLTDATTLTLGTASSLAGSVVFKNSSNAFTTTLKSGTPGSSLTIIMPASAGSNGDCIIGDGNNPLTLSMSSGCGGGGGTGITSLGGQTGSTQTFANDTNVTITSASNTHTIGWTGTLGLARGGTALDMTATGGTSKFLKQNTLGGAITVTQPLFTDISGALGAGQAVGNYLSITGVGTLIFGIWHASMIEVGYTEAKVVSVSCATPLTCSGTNPSAFSVANGAIANAKLADVATATFKGRATAGTGAPEDLTSTQATALLNVFTSSLKGLAPASGGGTLAFLRADGTWSVPMGSGNVTTTGAPASGNLTKFSGATSITSGDLTGDVSTAGALVATITTGAVTNAKLSTVPTAIIKGRTTAGTGVLEDLTTTQATALLDLFSSSLKGLTPASGGGATNYLRADGVWAVPAGSGGGTVTTTGSPASGNLTKFSGATAITNGDLSGDVTTSGALVSTIAAGVVTNAKLATVATATFKGRTTAGTGAPEDLTATQATALLNLFTTALQGLVPASGGGTLNYLRADGTFAVPPGAGGTFANPTALVGLSAVNGVATTAMRSDGAPALSQAIVPTWSGRHIFQPTVNSTSTVFVTNSSGVAVLNVDTTNSRVGIRTATPEDAFHIFGSATSDVFAGMGPSLSSGPALNFGYSGSTFGRGSAFFNTRPDASAIAPNPSLRFLTGNTQRMIITNIGRVGVGTAAPAYDVDVVGDVNVTGCFRVASVCIASGGGITGTLTAGLVTFATGASTIATDTAYGWDNTNKRLFLGAGLTPTKRFHVVTSTTAGDGIAVEGNASNMRPSTYLKSTGATTVREWALQVVGDGAAPYAGAFSIVDSTGSATPLTISTAGVIESVPTGFVPASSAIFDGSRAMRLGANFTTDAIHAVLGVQFISSVASTTNQMSGIWVRGRQDQPNSIGIIGVTAVSDINTPAGAAALGSSWGFYTRPHIFASMDGSTVGFEVDMDNIGNVDQPYVYGANGLGAGNAKNGFVATTSPGSGNAATAAFIVTGNWHHGLWIDGGGLNASNAADSAIEVNSGGGGQPHPALFKVEKTGLTTIAHFVRLYPSGTTPDTGYPGQLQITKPAASGQYISLIRAANYPWAIGTVYNTSTFAIGTGQLTDSSFTAPEFQIDTAGNVKIKTLGAGGPFCVQHVGGVMSSTGIACGTGGGGGNLIVSSLGNTQVPYATGATTATGSANLVWINATPALGIGTASPRRAGTASVDVAGTIAFTNAANLSGVDFTAAAWTTAGGGAIGWNKTSSAGEFSLVAVSGGGADGGFSFYDRNTQLLRVFKSGAATLLGALTITAFGGGGTQCLQVDNAGLFARSGALCGSGGNVQTSAFTAGRVPYTIGATTLADSPTLTWNNTTSTLTITNTNSAAPSEVLTGTVSGAVANVTTTIETGDPGVGGNAGLPFNLYAAGNYTFFANLNTSTTTQALTTNALTSASIIRLDNSLPTMAGGSVTHMVYTRNTGATSDSAHREIYGVASQNVIDVGSVPGDTSYYGVASQMFIKQRTSGPVTAFSAQIVNVATAGVGGIFGMTISNGIGGTANIVAATDALRIAARVGGSSVEGWANAIVLRDEFTGANRFTVANSGQVRAGNGVPDPLYAYQIFGGVTGLAKGIGVQGAIQTGASGLDTAGVSGQMTLLPGAAGTHAAAGDFVAYRTSGATTAAQLFGVDVRVSNAVAIPGGLETIVTGVAVSLVDDTPGAVSGGTAFLAHSESGMTWNWGFLYQAPSGATLFGVDNAGTLTVSSLKTTGSAGSKKVVCVDTTTGILYASSTGTDCSN